MNHSMYNIIGISEINVMDEISNSEKFQQA